MVNVALKSDAYSEPSRTSKIELYFLPIWPISAQRLSFVLFCKTFVLTGFYTKRNTSQRNA